MRLPGGAGPDLVLVVVVALGLTGGPLEGMLGGFCAGLALDVAPPATHLVGQYALVFCLVGYAAGRVGSHLNESAWAPIGVAALGAAVGELLFALTGMIFGNLDITWSAVGHVLPASVVYDVLLSPFVLYAVIRARALAAPSLASQGLAGFPGGSAGQPLGVPGLAGAVALFSGAGAVVRDSGTGAAPRLKARTLRAGSSQGGSASGARPPQARPSRAVHLKFGGGGGSALSSGSAAAARAGRPHPGRPVNLHLGTRHRFGRNRGRPAGRYRDAGQLAARRRDPGPCVQPVRRVRPGQRLQPGWQRPGGRCGRAGTPAVPGPAAAGRGHAGRVRERRPGGRQADGHPSGPAGDLAARFRAAP